MYLLGRGSLNLGYCLLSFKQIVAAPATQAVGAIFRYFCKNKGLISGSVQLL